MDGSRIILAAHRGDKLHFPENTMPAFQAALDAGVDMIETDIHMTMDGHLVILHDRNTLRTTGTSGLVDQMTIGQLRALDAGSWFSPAFSGTRIPTVEEFMEWIAPTDLLINWEFKDYPRDLGAERAIQAVDKLIMMIQQHGLQNRSMVNSFSNLVLEHCFSLCGHDLPIHGQGIHSCRRSHEVTKTPEEELFDWCCLYAQEKGHHPLEYPENFVHCTSHGILPCLCIPDLPEDYHQAIDLGCRMFTSNNIQKGDQVLRQIGVR